MNQILNEDTKTKTYVMQFTSSRTVGNEMNINICYGFTNLLQFRDDKDMIFKYMWNYTRATFEKVKVNNEQF